MKAKVPQILLSAKDLGLAVLLDILNIPSTKAVITKKPEMVSIPNPNIKSIVPMAELPSGAKVSGPVTIAKYLMSLASTHSEWLGTTDVEKEAVQQQINEARNLAESLNTTKDKMIPQLQTLNTNLAQKVFISTNYFTLADLFMYAALYLPVCKLNKNERFDLCNVTRYFDLLQNLAHASGKVTSTDLVLIDMDIPVSNKPVLEEKKKEKPAADDKAKAATGAAPAASKDKKAANDAKPAADSAPRANGDAKVEKKADKKEAKPATPTEKKEVAAPEPAAAVEGPAEPERLDIRVGRVLSVTRHAQADTLYVEEIDVGEETPRTVVSGLVKYMKESDIQNRMVVLLCNLKPQKMRGVESQAMVLAATSAEGVVELLDAPPGSKPGDRCWFDNYKGNDYSQLNAKKKIWEGVQPRLRTDSRKRAVYAVTTDGIKYSSVLRTEKGEVTVKTVVDASIK
ncbi:hypothetical protein HDU76_011466 [Blyttiomyces sp. JEL0837]|nr:hypothetical protein HDU76_011466 [Blyttiomyces sp. JEL0837]